MKQATFSSAGFDQFSKKTRKERFLEQMNAVIPWQDLVQMIEPFFPNPKGPGRRPVSLEYMLRILFLQHWYSLTDPGAEEALYDAPVFRRFVGIDLGREPVPDETTICKFRHRLEENNLGEMMFQKINAYLASLGLKAKTGTIVDATIISAPSSTKNRRRQRDPEMHHTRKGGKWHFGIKAHIGVDSKTKLIHHVQTTAANVNDCMVMEKLLHGKEKRVYGDAAYRGQKQRIKGRAPHARDFTQARAYSYRPLSSEEKAKNKTKSRVRAKVEHPFAVLKRRFGFSKVRYKGLRKNEHWLSIAFALVNLAMAGKELFKRKHELLQANCA